MNFFKCNSTMRERRLNMLNSGLLSDCEFLVGLDCSESTDSDYCDSHSHQDEDYEDTASDKPRHFCSHRMLLASASEVFERMFYGELPEPPGGTIYVSDVTPRSFEIFLKYIYTYELDVAEVQLQQACYLMYLGNKYLIQDFTDACVKALIDIPWQLGDIFPMFDLACLYENLPLMLSCYARIQAKADQLLTHRTFYNLNVNCLKRLVVLLSSHPVQMHCSRLLLALEKFGLSNSFENGSKSFETLREAASVLNFSKLTPVQYELGPARSYLFHPLVCSSSKETSAKTNYTFSNCNAENIN